MTSLINIVFAPVLGSSGARPLPAAGEAWQPFPRARQQLLEAPEIKIPPPHVVPNQELRTAAEDALQ
jgi:hypothetical protein